LIAKAEISPQMNRKAAFLCMNLKFSLRSTQNTQFNTHTQNTCTLHTNTGRLATTICYYYLFWPTISGLESSSLVTGFVHLKKNDEVYTGLGTTGLGTISFLDFVKMMPIQELFLVSKNTIGRRLLTLSCFTSDQK
jgi:hypothetical protein